MAKYRTYTEEEAKQAIKDLLTAIENFKNNDYAAINLEWYLERHFETWANRWANTPEGFINELLRFSEIN